MVITYSDAILRTFVAQVCRDMGWHASHTTSLEVLTHITSSYMRYLAKNCIQFANHCGRQSPNLNDIALAFEHFNIDLNELKDYVTSVESTPFELSVPKFPVPNVSNRVLTNTGEGEERPEWYYEWLPPLRETRTTGSADETGETSKANEDTLQDSLMSPTSSSNLQQEFGSSSPKRGTSGVDSFGFLRDLHLSVGQREGRLPDTQRIIESDDSRDNSPERQEKVEEKVKIEDKDKKREKKKKELKDERKKQKLKLNKENSLKIKAIISKDKIRQKEQKKIKKFLKIKDLSKRSYSPLSIKVTGLSTGTPTATSTPTMARSPASVASPDGQRSINANVDSSINAVIDRICADNEVKASPKKSEETPKKKYRIKREDSAEKKNKRVKKEINEVSMSETIDDVIRQSHNALLSPHKRSPHQMMSPKVKSETIPTSSPNKSQIFDDDEAAHILVSMAGEKSIPKRKKNKPSATATGPQTSNESNSAFQSAMSSFPKVSPGVSPLSPTICNPNPFSMSNQNPFFPTPPLFGHMSPPLLTPALQTSPHEPYQTPPPLTKPKTLAEKKALPPEIMNAPVIKKEKDKENKTDKKDRERDRKDKKSSKLKNKKFKSRKTISDDSSSSEDEKKPKLNIKLGSTSKQSNPTEKLSVKTISETKPVKTLLSPKHNVPNQEDLSNKKKRGPKKKSIKEEVKEDKSCIVIRETITVDTGEGDGKVWICPSCKGPDDGSPMIGESSHMCERSKGKITRSGRKY